MAGETIKTPAICLFIRPWSRTSHVTGWLTPNGCVTTLVKGANRTKSAFLGQYDLNYTCEMLYYARAHGDVHALRECSPLDRRDGLRGCFRALALTDWFRLLARNLAPTGPEARGWFELLGGALDALEREAALTAAYDATTRQAKALATLLDFELKVLELAGLSPDFDESADSFQLRGERTIPVTPEMVRCLRNPRLEKNLKILVDAARAIGVFYTFHLDCAPDVRRTVLRMILS